jgi:hypothetical protein
MLRYFDQFLIKESIDKNKYNSSKDKIDVFANYTLKTFLDSGAEIKSQIKYRLDFEAKKIETYYMLTISNIKELELDSVEILQAELTRLVKFFKSKAKNNSIVCVEGNPSLYKHDFVLDDEYFFDVKRAYKPDIVKNNIGQIIFTLDSFFAESLVIAMLLDAEDMSITKVIDFIVGKEDEDSKYVRNESNEIIGANVSIKKFSYNLPFSYEMLVDYLNKTNENIELKVMFILGKISSKYFYHISQILNRDYLYKGLRIDTMGYSHRLPSFIEKIDEIVEPLIHTKYSADIRSKYKKTTKEVIKHINAGLSKYGMSIEKNFKSDGFCFVPLNSTIEEILYSKIEKTLLERNHYKPIYDGSLPVFCDLLGKLYDYEYVSKASDIRDSLDNYPDYIGTLDTDIIFGAIAKIVDMFDLTKRDI